MSWFRKLTAHATQPGEAVPVAPSLADTVRTLQVEMLSMLAPVIDPRADHARRRILQAADIAGLWFVRSELAAVLAAHLGEEQAMARVESLSETFERHLPVGLRPRRHGLGR